MKSDERKLEILKAIVKIHVKTGEPVGSKVLCDYLDFSVSSATIRNDMFDLCELGFLEKLHTSSGKVPSNKGYRLYINKLMDKKDLSEEEKSFISFNLSSCKDDPLELLSKASELLSALTNFAAVSITPPVTGDTIKKIEFIQTGRKSAMLIFITSSGLIKNKLFRCDYDLTPEVLKIFTALANEKFSGLNVSKITPAFVQTVAASLGEMTLLMPTVLSSILEAANDCINVNMNLMGQSNLLLLPEFDNNNAKTMIEFLNKQNEVINLILNTNNNSTSVLIGSETNKPALLNSSIVISHYNSFDKPSCTLAIIGPTRMDYSKIITNLEYLTSSVGNILSEILDDDE